MAVVLPMNSLVTLFKAIKAEITLLSTEQQQSGYINTGLATAQKNYLKTVASLEPADPVASDKNNKELLKAIMAVKKARAISNK